MYKKIIGAVIVVSVVMGGTSVFASPGKDLRMLPIIVNGQKVRFPDTEPYVDTNGRTMVPVRFVSEKLGGEVEWEGKTQTVVINYKDKVISLPVGSTTVSVDDTTIELDTAAEIYEGRTMVPLRFVSEAMESTVKFDKDAYSVLVTDAAYAAKVASGEVKLNDWGRELSNELSEDWYKLSDLPASFYDIKKTTNWGLTNKEFMAVTPEGKTKKYIDEWSEHIRQYYATQLNFDYRTVNSDAFVDSLMENTTERGGYFNSEARAVMKDYVVWAKKNKVVSRGYADPENSLIRYELGRPIVRVYFKYMIISAVDSSQTYLDNYNPTEYSESIKLKLGVWYGGYSDVALDSTAGNMQWKDYAVNGSESMFGKGRYSYSILTSSK
ncbi:copper amine oxidase N-terminal domain-containing protein [Cohnella lupini]|uniref:Copper amine oxidase-like protein n=1 Tax=Cohnella lupini TaxID=1294267 RepID=A0A3D9IMS7_9BACL|nr:copper amine oxidase N-terminal domain-containing protein [Cohnella lupini]RED63011.1 copper amine oxidase-like protein [Cohnella lupini]